MSDPTTAGPPGHIYVFVRKDLPLADQMVQASHVCLEAGRVFDVPCGCSLVLLEVEDESALRRAIDYGRRCGIPVHAFHEPDPPDDASGLPMGLTAACTPCLNPRQRRHLRHFPLWNSG